MCIYFNSRHLALEIYSYRLFQKQFGQTVHRRGRQREGQPTGEVSLQSREQDRFRRQMQLETNGRLSVRERAFRVFGQNAAFPSGNNVQNVRNVRFGQKYGARIVRDERGSRFGSKKITSAPLQPDDPETGTDRGEYVSEHERNVARTHQFAIAADERERYCFVSNRRVPSNFATIRKGSFY